MKKILHLGAFDRNIGDNIALINAQKLWKKNIKEEIQFKNFDIGNFWKNNNDINASKKIFSKISKEYDCILVGGGGLVECQDHHATGWKLPFNKKVFQSISIPTFFQGVGINCFRGGSEYTDKAKNSLSETIDNASVFSVRNDGSKSKLDNWIGIKNKKVIEVPDPGLMHYNDHDIKLEKLENLNVKIFGIQPAWNGGGDLKPGINLGRFINQDNIDFIKSLTSNMKVYPHTGKDFNRLKGKTIVSLEEFKTKYRYIKNTYDFINKYNEVDCVIAMRGHGQLITIGMNLPGIYLSTQDKVRDFSLLNGFEDYNVDILEDNWQDKLKNYIYLMKNEEEYVKNWFNIRKNKIKKWKNQDSDFINECMRVLKWNV